MAREHSENLQTENLGLVEDVDRLQKIASGLEELNKQFSDLEERQEQEKARIITEKDAEMLDIAEIVKEKQSEVMKVASLIEEFQARLEEKESELQHKCTELEQLREANAAQLKKHAMASNDHQKAAEELAKRDERYSKLKRVSK